MCTGDTSVSLTHIQVEVHTQKNLRRAVSVFVGPGKWLGFKLLREHRETLELGFGLGLWAPHAASYLQFISSLSQGYLVSVELIKKKKRTGREETAH